jgi:hypothetical protein
MFMMRKTGVTKKEIVPHHPRTRVVRVVLQKSERTHALQKKAL